MSLADNFIKPNNPILTKKADKVLNLNSLETLQIIKRMFDVAYGEQKDARKPLLVGLAAPQIGISKRIILVDVIANGKGVVGDLRVFINPKITWMSSTKSKWYEACYSTDRVCGIVSRPSKIKLQAYSREGNLLEEEYEGYTARIFQHEIDHLNGREFITHIRNDNDLHWVEDNEFVEYRNNEAWRCWTKKCPRKKWEKIKGIKS